MQQQEVQATNRYLNKDNESIGIQAQMLSALIVRTFHSFKLSPQWASTKYMSYTDDYRSMK